MHENAETLIIGSGPAGLAAAIGHGPGAVVLEKNIQIGGLCSSLTFGGTVFDFGGHSFHTPYDEVRRLVYEICQMFEQVRDARCFTHGELIPYPFQKHFSKLNNASVVEECSNGMAPAKDIGSARTLEEYLARFGSGIARHFLTPYNQKLWGWDLKEITADWVTQRIYSPTVGNNEITKGERTPLHDDTVVAYPARNGFGELTAALASRAEEIRLNVEVIGIDLDSKLAYTKNGMSFRWQHLVSTMPLEELIALLNSPTEIRTATTKLSALSLGLVMVALDSKLNTSIQRIYCADETSPAHKIVLNNNSSDYLRSLPNHGILGEVCLTNRNVDATALERAFVEGLLKIGIIQKFDQVKAIQTIRIRHGYPIPTRASVESALKIKNWLMERDVFTVGRFGEYDYINSDEAIMRGLQIGKRLAGEKCLTSR